MSFGIKGDDSSLDVVFCNAFNGFFKLDAIKSKVATAVLTNYAHVASGAKHFKRVVTAGMWLF